MPDTSYWEQARFWANEYRQRVPVSLARRLSPAVHAAVVNALEARSRPRDLSLDVSLGRVSDILLETRELAGSVPHRIPPVEGVLGEDVFYFPPIRVHHLRDVTFDVSSTLAFTRDWVINESGVDFRWAVDSSFLSGASVRVVAPGRRRAERTVAAVGNAQAFYHFLMEALPQMLRVREAFPDTTFVTSQTMKPPAPEILEHFGLAVEIVPENTVLDCSSFVLCEPFPRDRTHPADMDMLAEQLPKMGVRPDEQPERIYISRAKSLRRLHDEERLEDWLRERGYHIARLESLSYAQQVGLMAGATSVVGPHGAGLANTVVMQPGGSVVELTTTEWWTPAFRRLASVRGHRYTLLEMRTTPQAPSGSADNAIALLEPIIERR